MQVVEHDFQISGVHKRNIVEHISERRLMSVIHKFYILFLCYKCRFSLVYSGMLRSIIPSDRFGFHLYFVSKGFISFFLDLHIE